MRIAAVVLGLLVLRGSTPAAGGDAWEADLFRKQSTLEFLTVGPEEGEHWSTVWVVVLDGQPYLRLGSKAADRMEKNKSAPLVKIRIAGREIDHVRAEPAPDMAEKVGAAMAEKYWTDILVRYASHPLVIRLSPETPEPPKP
jgi:hypothetical protein